jgi:hypothetical protein
VAISLYGAYAGLEGTRLSSRVYIGGIDYRAYIKNVGMLRRSFASMKKCAVALCFWLICGFSACAPPPTVTVTVPETQTATLTVTTTSVTTSTTQVTTSSTIQATVTATPPTKTTVLIPPDTRAFQRPATDEYAKITASLTLYDPSSAPPGTGLNYIPYASTIIHWHNGITEAFGPDGKRLFIAKDAEAAQIPHPSGPNGPFTSPATQILQVPSGALIGGSQGSPDAWSQVSLNGIMILVTFNSQSSYPPT